MFLVIGSDGATLEHSTMKQAIAGGKWLAQPAIGGKVYVNYVIRGGACAVSVCSWAVRGRRRSISGGTDGLPFSDCARSNDDAEVK